MITLNTLLLTIGLVSIVVYYLLFNNKNKGKNFPPGPKGLPFIGSILSVGSTPHLTFSKWAKLYGPIVMTQLGNTRTIILNDVKLIKEAFNEQVFSGRTNIKVFQIISGGKIGIISADGNGWAEQRRFTLRNLRDFGFGKKSMEVLVMDEVTDIISWLKKNEGVPISINRKFGLAVLNSLWTIMTGERYKHDDPEINKISDTAQETFREVNDNGIPVFFSDLAERFPGITGYNKMEKDFAPLNKMFDNVIENRLKDPADMNNPRDFMDVYVNEINKTTDPNSTFYKETGVKNMRAVVSDLHGAGSETTSTTIAWAVLYLMKNPSVQIKLQQEIDTVIGNSRLPSLADKVNMPYIEAVMQEVLRMSSLVPIGVFHNTMNDTEFNGYFIPKNTMIISNLYHVHHNPETWGDPEIFRPERFLNPDGKSVIKHESVIPFSIGKRVCLGETLAREEFFLFLTTIFQKFQVNQDPKNPASIEPQCGFVLTPKPYTVIMKDRLE